MSKVPMTVRGHEMLEKELKKLKSKDRPDVIKAIAEARAHGDLKENAEYHAAKEQQGFIEARIKELEGKLSHKQIIDVTAVDAKGKVIFGSTVELIDENSGDETEYRIVGEDEADIKTGLISYTSPIARALIGKNEGDVVEVATPDSRQGRSRPSWPKNAVPTSQVTGFAASRDSAGTRGRHCRCAAPARRRSSCTVRR